MIDKLLKLATYYDQTLQFDKSDHIHEIIKEGAEQAYSDLLEEQAKRELNEQEYIKQKERYLSSSHLGPEFDKFQETGSTDHLRILSNKGSSRTIFDLGDYVLKVARPKAGEDGKHANKDDESLKLTHMFPKISIKTYEHAPDYSWIVQDKVREANTNDLSKYFGRYVTNADIIHYANLYKRESEKFNELDPRIQEFAKFEALTGWGDFHESNLGVTSNGKIVILDRGIWSGNDLYADDIISKRASIEDLYYKLNYILGNRGKSFEQSKEMLEAVKKHMAQELRLLGKGAEGVAITISPTKVLKVSINDTVGYFAKQLAKSDVPGKEFTVVIHDSGKLGYDHWWILEKLTELRSDALNSCLVDIRNLLDDFDDERKELLGELSSKESFNSYRPYTWPDELKQFVLKVVNSVFQKIKKDWDINADLNPNWLKNLIKTASLKFIIRGRSLDLRQDNIGLREDGNFVIFDH